MTVRARRRIWIAAIDQLAVGTGRINGIGLRMADTAINSWRHRLTRPFVTESCSAGVTLRAGNFRAMMYRDAELSGINK